MKKILKSYILATVIGFSLVGFTPTAQAFTPGWGGDITCKVWREGDPTGLGTGAAGYCDNTNEVFKRLYELEEAVDTLQAQNQLLKQQIAANKTTTSTTKTVNSTTSKADSARITALEKRMSAVETLAKRINGFVNTINKALRTLKK
jgi:hypothetical protein